MRRTSAFWLCGAVLTSPWWRLRDAQHAAALRRGDPAALELERETRTKRAGRDDDDDPRLARLESIEMGEWLRLPEATRAAIVEGYAYRRPPARRLATV
jgi:hypothetical protein